MRNIILIICCLSGICCIDPTFPESFERVDQGVASKYQQKIETYTGHTIEWNLVYFKATPVETNDFCNKGLQNPNLVFGCFFSYGAIVISDNYIDNCFAWSHELLHFYLYRTTGDPDNEHTNHLFNELHLICQNN